MKRKSLLFMLLFALLAPWAANAQNTITLNGNLTQAIEPNTSYTFYDSGGPNGNYSTSENYTATFTAPGNITLSFTSFNTESSYDYMYVYDGTTSGTVLLNMVSGTTIPSSVTATSGTMTVTWYSDSSVTRDGWVATITGPTVTTPYVTLTPSSATVITGSTQNLTASYGNVTGTPSITYSSSNTSVATVSGSGTSATVTGIAPGTATITATMTYNGNTYTATCAITVENPSYCTPSFGSNSDCITNITLGDINNTTASSSTNGYGDYTSMSTSLEQGETAILSLTSGGGSGTHAAAVWIDFNDNYTFETSERVGTYNSIGANQTVDIELTIPTDAALGNHRMRVVYQYNVAASDINPCASANYGEGEDYTVNITTTAACPKPTGLALTTDGETVTATWNGTASTYNIDINGTVTNNVTSPYTFNCALSTTYTVKVQANCGGGEISDWSSPQSITTPDCLGGRVIEYTLVDSFGDGWNGNAILVVDECGNLINSLTLESGSSISGTLEFCEGYYEFVFLEGSYKDETSWTFTEGGVTLFEGEGETTISGDILYALGDPTKPTDLVATPESDNVVVRWTENGTATAWQICLDGNEANLIAATTNPFTLTGLYPGTIYGVKVRSVNGSSYTCWSEVLAFVTTESCEAPTVPTISDITPFAANVAWTPTEGEFELRYRELAPQDNYFEDGTLGDWTTIDADGDGYDWYGLATENIPGYNGSTGLATSASYSGGALTPDNYLVSPQVSLGGSISFWACNQDAYAETIGVAVSIASNNDPADFTTLKTVTLPITRGGAYTTDSRSGNRAQTPWVYIYVDLSAYAGQTGYVAIRHYNCTDKFRVNVDNIMIEQPNDEWTVVSNATSPVALTDLTPETDYEVEVRTVCHSNDYSRWMSNTFTTPSSCEAPTNVNVPAETLMPTTAVVEWNGYQDSYEVWYRPVATGAVLLEDDFEDGTLNNWTMVDADGDGDNWQIATPADYGIGDAHSGTYCASSWSWNSETLYPDNYMISPLVDGAASITYYVATNAAYPDHYAVMASSTNTDITSFTIVFEEDAYSGSKGNGTKSSMIKAGTRAMSDWAEKTVQLPAGTKYVAFRHYNSDDMNYLFIDDVTISGSAGEEQEWMQATTDGTSIILGEDEALIPETTYECKVHGENRNCGDEGYTEFSETINFTTPGLCDNPNTFTFETLEATTATLNWIGYQESYNVLYRTAEVGVMLWEDFSNGGSGWSTYNLNEESSIYTLGSDEDTWKAFGFVGDGTTQYLISPELESSDAIADSLYFFYYAYQGSTQAFKVGFSETYSLDGFTWGDEITTSSSDYYGYYEGVIPAGTKYFAIQSSGESSYLFVTDFYAVDYTNYVAPGEWVRLTVNEPSVTMQPLTPNTEYEVYVQGICGEGEDDVTNWIGGYFTTPELTTLTQTIELAEGSNWISFYVETNLADLQAALEEVYAGTNMMIQGINAFTTYNGSRWRGSLNRLDLSQMYMIEVTERGTIDVEGEPLNPADLAITINEDANWIGFPFSTEMTVENAFAGAADQGDMIQGKNAFATYNGSRWRGALNTLVPGQGYIYTSTTNKDDFYYPTNTSKAGQTTLQLKPFAKNRFEKKSFVPANIMPISK